MVKRAKNTLESSMSQKRGGHGRINEERKGKERKGKERKGKERKR